jgi:L-asparaginase
MIKGNKKLKFSIISCGGTILMTPNERGILEPTKSVNDVLNEINLSALKDNVNVVIERRLEIFKLDSSNLNPEHWKQIIEAIEIIQDDCDGIVIFHGTDTMAYSATAAGLLLSSKLKIPIVFTGSQVSNGITGTDTKSNVERAFLTLYQAASQGVKDVMIFFGYEAYRGVNSRKRSESDFQGFESPSVPPLYVTGGLGIRPMLPPRTASDVAISKKRIGIELQNEFASGVVVLTTMPGLEPDIVLSIASLDATKAIILHSLGAGNIPALEGKFNLIPAIYTITHTLKKPVIIASPYVGGATNMDVYLPGRLAKEAGAINAGRMTTEATVVKTRLLLAQPEFNKSIEKFKKALEIDFAGETCST